MHKKAVFFPKLGLKAAKKQLSYSIQNGFMPSTPAGQLSTWPIESLVFLKDAVRGSDTTSLENVCF